MTEIQQNRWDQLLRRVGGLLGPGAKVKDALTELFPMFDVENMPGELLRLGGVRLCLGGGQLAGVVAQSATAVLENPPDSGILATLERVDVGTATASPVRWGVQNGFRATATALGTEDFRDVREFAPDQPVLNVRQVVELALANGTCQSHLRTNDHLILDPPNGVCVLPPGTSFEIGLAAQDVQLFYSFSWRERVAEQSELNL